MFKKTIIVSIPFFTALKTRKPMRRSVIGKISLRRSTASLSWLISPADRGLNHGVDVPRVEPVARAGLTIGDDLHAGLPHRLEHPEVLHADHAVHHVDDRSGVLLVGREIGAEHFDRVLPFDAADRLF